MTENIMKTKKCEECGTEHKINYIYTHYKSKKHIRNKNKSSIPNLITNTDLKSQYTHFLTNINNIFDICNHLKEYISEKLNKEYNILIS